MIWNYPLFQIASSQLSLLVPCLRSYIESCLIISYLLSTLGLLVCVACSVFSLRSCVWYCVHGFNRLMFLFFLSAVFSWLLLWFLVPQLRVRMIDYPNSRSSHKSPTPRGGGLVFVSITLNMLATLHPRIIFSFEIVWYFLTRPVAVGQWLVLDTYTVQKLTLLLKILMGFFHFPSVSL